MAIDIFFPRYLLNSKTVENSNENTLFSFFCMCFSKSLFSDTANVQLCWNIYSTQFARWKWIIAREKKKKLHIRLQFSAHFYERKHNFQMFCFVNLYTHIFFLQTTKKTFPFFGGIYDRQVETSRKKKFWVFKIASVWFPLIIL